MHAPLLLLLLACAQDEPAPSPAPPPAAADAPVPGPAVGADPDASAPPEASAPAEEPAPLAGPAALPPGAPDRIAASHILVAWQGAVGADPALRRTKAEALARARALRERVAGGEDLAAVAKATSDGPSAPRGGSLGAFGQGVMNPRFEAAAFRLAVGQLSDVVETPFGYHLIRRDPLTEVHLAHVVVQHAGAERTVSGRTEDEARARAEEARTRLLAGEPVATVAAALSDGPSAIRGGDLGWFQAGQLLPQVEEAAFALKKGGVSEVIPSPMGFHVVVRLD